nr:PepSY domain-containing protein [Sphingomonas ginkgonis]
MLRTIRNKEHCMRKWHRWTSVLFGLFMLWIAVTGVVVQGGRIYAQGQPRPAAAPAAPGAPQVREREGPPPAAAGQRPPQSRLRQVIHFVTELHSGEQFGIVGMVLSLLSGAALVFFSVSGMWMYVQLYTGRLKRLPNPTARERFFWR